MTELQREHSRKEAYLLKLSNAAVEAGGVIKNMHSTDSGSLPPLPRVCLSIISKGKSCSDLGRVLVLDDPPARMEMGTTVLGTTDYL